MTQLVDLFVIFTSWILVIAFGVLGVLFVKAMLKVLGKDDLDDGNKAKDEFKKSEEQNFEEINYSIKRRF